MTRNRVPGVLRAIERHLLSALLTGAGVTLLAAGLFAYVLPLGASSGVVASPAPSPSPTTVLVVAPPAPSAAPASAPYVSPSATPSPGTAVATRVVIPALRIDLPVVAPRASESFPLCNVAEYWPGPGGPAAYVQPGHDGTTYLFAHARLGMFLPLLEGSQVNNGAAMIGYTVFVYTSDSRVYWYSIAAVRRRLPYDDLTPPPMLPGTTRQLVLQTSETPSSTGTKLQVLARFELEQPAGYAESHPAAHPVVCS